MVNPGIFSWNQFLAELRELKQILKPDYSS